MFHEYHLPAYPVPEGYTNEEFFRKLCYDGFRERYPDEPEEYKQRLEYEIGVISRMGYVNYYLIVWDFIHYAKTTGIPVGPGRGSGAASIAAYCSMGLIMWRRLLPLAPWRQEVPSGMWAER